MARILIAEAVHDENRKYKGGEAGDQTGDEVRLRLIYNRPWDYLIRWKDEEAAKKFAEAMWSAANNNKVGYDQMQRNTLLTYAKKVGYNPGKVTESCECDCSSLVSVAAMYAGIPEETLFRFGNCSTTANLRSRLTGTGKLTSKKISNYSELQKDLRVGDILLYEGHHVAGVIEVGEVSTIQKKKTNIEIAKEVIAGKWSEGIVRKEQLEKAGYNYAEIQTEVNKLLKK